MGTSINLFIEYDESARVAYERGTLESLTDPPFMHAAVSVAWDSLCWDKEYAFFAAIAGGRNESDIRPLYPPRGLPESLSTPARRHLLEDDGQSPAGHTPGWLHYGEIVAALEHMSVPSSHLGFPVQLMLQIMAYLSEYLGEDRVRLVWTFD